MKGLSCGSRLQYVTKRCIRFPWAMIRLDPVGRGISTKVKSFFVCCKKYNATAGTRLLMVDFFTILLNAQYDRPTLAELWGYESHHAISKGVITPKGQNIVVLFITKEKQKNLTQYEDHIDEDILFWEGEEKHGTDLRIASGKDTVHVLYRERHHSSFVYKGRAALKHHQLLTNRPSKFVFHLVDLAVTTENIVSDIQNSYGLSVTEKEAIIKSRIGQGKFRKNAFELWKSCAVTGFAKRNVLVASHIKPWRVSNNEERITPHNSLVLLPTLDKLFDKGYISFETSGQIQLANTINQSDLLKAGITKELKLREVPSTIKPFLEYHQEYVFGLGSL
jgi:putative restriction endonuclease